MKKIKFFAIGLAIALIAGVAIFYACSKDKEETVNNLATHEATVEEKDYEVQIEDLIATTGIDIYKLSELKEVKKVVDKQIQMRNTLIAMENATEKGALTDEKAAQIKNIAQSIQTEYNKGNYAKVYTLYESLCAICKTIDGFIPGINEYGLQTFTYDINKEPVQLPITYMETEKASTIAFVGAIQASTPQFVTLSPPVQTQVMAATIYVGVQRSMIGAKVQYMTCRERAKKDYDGDMALIKAAYIAAMAGCGVSTLAVAPCAIIATGVMIYASVGARETYGYRVKLCDLQGYY